MKSPFFCFFLISYFFLIFSQSQNYSHILGTALNHLITENNKTKNNKCSLVYTFTEGTFNIDSLYLFDYDLIQKGDIVFQLNYTSVSNQLITLKNNDIIQDKKFIFSYKIDNLEFVVDSSKEILQIKNFEISEIFFDKNGTIVKFNYFSELKNNIDTIVIEVNDCIISRLSNSLSRINQLTTDFIDIILKIRKDYTQKEVFFIIENEKIRYSVQYLDVHKLFFNLGKTSIIDKTTVDIKEVTIEFEFAYNNKENKKLYKGKVQWEKLIFKGKEGAFYDGPHWEFEEVMYLKEHIEAFTIFFIGVFTDYFNEFYNDTSINYFNI